MSLVTGTPIGNLDLQEDIYLEGAPSLYIQDATATPLYNPDAQGFYWGMSGTSTYPVYEIGCPTDMSFTENLTTYDVLCDNVGVKKTVQQRQFLEFTFTVQSLFPLQTLRILLKGGAVTQSSPKQQFGFGKIDNSKYWMLYAPKVYDEDYADYVWLHFHKCMFVDAWTINMPFGNAWQVTGIKLRAFADTTKPTAQQFGSMGRSDLSVIA